MDLGTGVVNAAVELPHELFYETLSEQSGLEVRDDGDLISLLSQLSKIKREYDRIDAALQDVRTRGYGIVMPSREELHLEEPEIVRQGGRYGVRLKASAPSIHMIMANIETEVSPPSAASARRRTSSTSCCRSSRATWARSGSRTSSANPCTTSPEKGSTPKSRRCREETQAKLQEAAENRQRRQRRPHLHHPLAFVRIHKRPALISARAFSISAGYRATCYTALPFPGGRREAVVVAVDDVGVLDDFLDRRSTTVLLLWFSRRWR